MHHTSFVKTNSVLFLAILLLAVLQQSRFLAVSGVNPNLIVAGLAAFVFFASSFTSYMFAAAVGALVMKSVPALEYSSAAILILAIFFWTMRLTAPWRFSIPMFVATAGGSALFYAMVDYHFLLNHPSLFVYELAYNLIFAAVLYLSSAYVYGEER